MPDADALGDDDWLVDVEVREDPALAEVLAGRLPPPERPRDLSVTELVAPRRAYFRAVSPVPIPAPRGARIDAGRALHERLGRAMATEGTLEVRVRRGGYVGRIDLLSDVPVEIKTTHGPVGSPDPSVDRPDQVEQLGMYASLLDRSGGRLVTVRLESDRPEVHAVDLRFPDPSGIRTAMEVTAESLRSAWRARDPSGLPRCRWFGRGCEYRDAGVCGCTGEETEPVPWSGRLAGVAAERPDWAERVERHLAGVGAARAAPAIDRFRDLLYPRRAYFERTVGPISPEPIGSDPSAPADLFERLRAALESGPLGEVARLAPRGDGPAEEVGGFRGDPFLLRRSRGWERLDPRELLVRQPQYALELGFRCVATGTGLGRLVLGRERAADDSQRIQVLECRFPRPTTFARRWRERARDLERAIAESAPQRLPRCPRWMVDSCPYVAACGCGEGPPRSQR